MNVALKLKAEEARREADEAMKKVDQKMIEMKSVFHKKKKRETPYQKNTSCAKFKNREQ